MTPEEPLAALNVAVHHEPSVTTDSGIYEPSTHVMRAPVTALEPDYGDDCCLFFEDFWHWITANQLEGPSGDKM